MASKRTRRSSRRWRVSRRLRRAPVPRPVPKASSSSATSRSWRDLAAAATSSAMATTVAAAGGLVGEGGPGSGQAAVAGRGGPGGLVGGELEVVVEGGGQLGQRQAD